MAQQIITGREARELPLGSVILLETPEPGAPSISIPMALTNHPALPHFADIGDNATFRVLHVPPVPVQVGDVFEFDWSMGGERLNALPAGSVLRDADGDVAVQVDPGTWELAGVGESMTSARLSNYFTYPVRVLSLGEGG